MKFPDNRWHLLLTSDAASYAQLVKQPEIVTINNYWVREKVRKLCTTDVAYRISSFKEGVDYPYEWKRKQIYI